MGVITDVLDEAPPKPAPVEWVRVEPGSFVEAFVLHGTDSRSPRATPLAQGEGKWASLSCGRSRAIGASRVASRFVAGGEVMLRERGQGARVALVGGGFYT